MANTKRKYSSPVNVLNSRNNLNKTILNSHILTDIDIFNSFRVVYSILTLFL